MSLPTLATRPDRVAPIRTVRLSAVAAASRPSARTDGLLLPMLLLVLFLIYIFVGVSPLSDGAADARVEGNVVDRLAVFGLAGLAALILAGRMRTTALLVRRSWLVWVLLGWFSASVAWSAYPDLSVRRIVSVILLTVVCLAIGAGFRGLRHVHAILAVVLTAVVLANLAAFVLKPGFAITDIGVRGIYTQKNQAGLVGMVAVVVVFAWTLAQRRMFAIVLGLGATAVAGFFLLITDSKTSMALTALAVLAMPAMLALRRLGAARSALVAGGLTAVALVAGLFYTALGGSWIALASGGGDGTFTGRTEIWDFALREIGQRPWLGVGYGAFWDVGLENDPLLRAPPGDWLSQVKIGVINQAHDGFLDLLLQGGVPALVLALLVWGQVTGRLVALFFGSDRTSGDRTTSLMFLVLMVVFLIHNVTETSIWSRGQMLASLTTLVTFFAFAAGRGAGTPGGRQS